MVRISKGPEERQNEIMNAAWRLFIERGFENTAVSDIVKEVGVAQGTFYYYFKTKEAILSAILDRMLEEITEKLKGIAALKVLNSDEKLKAIIGYVATMDFESMDLTKFIQEDRNITIQHELGKKFTERFLPIFMDIVKMGTAEGQFNTAYPEDVVKILFTGIGAYLLDEILVAKDAARILEALEVTADTIEKVLGAKKGSIKLV